MKYKTFLSTVLATYMMMNVSNPAHAGGGSMDSSPPATSTPNPPPTPLPSSTSGLNIPGGNIIQQNISPVAIAPTTCSSLACFFVNGQIVPGGYGQPSSRQVSAGVILQLPSSIDRANADLARSNAESNRVNIEIAKNKANQEIIDSLRTQLFTAIERNQPAQIIAIAIELAPKVGYSDYRVYLQTITGGKFIAP